MIRLTSNRFHTSLLTAVTLAILALISPTAGAQESDSGPLGWITFTPRLWISTIDPGDSGTFVRENVVVPMAGISATMSPPAIPNMSFALTILGGSGTGDVALIDGIGTTNVTRRDLDGDFIRVDLEFLARYQVGDSPISIFAGPRYIHLDEQYDGDFTDYEATENDVALQFGLGAATELGTSGRHRLFGNIATGVVFVDSEFDLEVDGFTETGKDKDEFPMLDLNTGYQYILRDHISLNARYRFFIVFNEDEFGFDSSFIVHGPEFGATFSF